MKKNKYSIQETHSELSENFQAIVDVLVSVGELKVSDSLIVKTKGGNFENLRLVIPPQIFTVNYSQLLRAPYRLCRGV